MYNVLYYQSTDNVTTSVRNRARGRSSPEDFTSSSNSGSSSTAVSQAERNKSWKRIILLIIAITVHNIPGDFTWYHTVICMYTLTIVITLYTSIAIQP